MLTRRLSIPILAVFRLNTGPVPHQLRATLLRPPSLVPSSSSAPALHPRGPTRSSRVPSWLYFAPVSALLHTSSAQSYSAPAARLSALHEMKSEPVHSPRDPVTQSRHTFRPTVLRLEATTTLQSVRVVVVDPSSQLLLLRARAMSSLCLLRASLDLPRVPRSAPEPFTYRPVLICPFPLLSLLPLSPHLRTQVPTATHPSFSLSLLSFTPVRCTLHIVPAHVYHISGSPSFSLSQWTSRIVSHIPYRIRTSSRSYAYTYLTHTHPMHRTRSHDRYHLGLAHCRHPRFF